MYSSSVLSTRNKMSESDLPFRSSSTCNFLGDTLGDEKGLVATHVLTFSCRIFGLVGTGRIKMELSSSFSLSLSDGSRNTSFLPKTDFLLPPEEGEWEGHLICKTPKLISP